MMKLETVLARYSEEFRSRAGVIEYTPGEALGYNGLARECVDLLSHHSRLCTTMEREGRLSISKSIHDATALIGHAKRVNGVLVRETVKKRMNRNKRNLHLDQFFLYDNVLCMIDDVLDWIGTSRVIADVEEKEQTPEAESYAIRARNGFQLNQLLTAQDVEKDLNLLDAKTYLLSRALMNARRTSEITPDEGIGPSGSMHAAASRLSRHLSILLPLSQERRAAVNDGLYFSLKGIRSEGLNIGFGVDLCHFYATALAYDYENDQPIPSMFLDYITAAKHTIRLIEEEHDRLGAPAAHLNMQSHILLHSFRDMHDLVRNLDGCLEQEVGLDVRQELRDVYRLLLPVASEITPARYKSSLRNPYFLSEQKRGSLDRRAQGF